MSAATSQQFNRAERRRSAGDKTRRARWLDAVHMSGVSRGAVAWAVCLAQRSNATARPVWGYQVGQADEIDCSDRQVRRYRLELERAGLIETVRGAIERRPDGTVARTMTNLYRFVVGPLRRRHKPSSDRPDTHDRSNPSSSRRDKTFPRKVLPKIVLIDDGWSADDFSPDDPWATART